MLLLHTVSKWRQKNFLHTKNEQKIFSRLKKISFHIRKLIFQPNFNCIVLAISCLISHNFFFTYSLLVSSVLLDETWWKLNFFTILLFWLWTWLKVKKLIHREEKDEVYLKEIIKVFFVRGFKLSAVQLRHSLHVILDHFYALHTIIAL